MGENVLKHLGVRAYQAKRVKLSYQQEDVALVGQLAASFFAEDDKSHVLKVQQKSDDLAQVLNNNQHVKQHRKNNDSGWNETNLVEGLGKK